TFDKRADLLAWGKPADLDSWPEIPVKRDEWRQWFPEARLAVCFEEAGREPDEFARFLASPYPERLAWELLLELLRIDSERAKQALILWTDALLGTVHRRLGDR